MGVNFTINGADVLVPMVVEEPSVVAAVSSMARLVRRAGDSGVEHRQRHVRSDPGLDVPDLDRAVTGLEAARSSFMDAMVTSTRVS